VQRSENCTLDLGIFRRIRVLRPDQTRSGSMTLRSRVFARKGLLGRIGAALAIAEIEPPWSPSAEGSVSAQSRTHRRARQRIDNKASGIHRTTVRY